MNNIILVRHGQSIGNADKSVYHRYPDWKLPLTEKGEHQARNVGFNLLTEHQGKKFVGFYSPMIRAKETYNIIDDVTKGMIVKGFESPLISEQSLGMMPSMMGIEKSYDGVLRDRKLFGEFYYRPHMGEAGIDVYTRAKLFLGELLRTPLLSENVLIVSHGFFIRIFLMALLNWSVDEFHTVRHPRNGQLIHVEYNVDTGWVLRDKLETKNKDDIE